MPAVVVDSDRNVVAFNAAFADTFGSPRVGRPLHSLDFAWMEALGDSSSPGLGPKPASLTTRDGQAFAAAIHRTRFQLGGENRLLVVVQARQQETAPTPIAPDIAPAVRELDGALHVIASAAEDALMLKPTPPIAEELVAIREAAAVARRATGRLLELERATAVAEAVDLSALVMRQEGLLRSTAGDAIILELRLAQTLPPVSVPVKKLEQLVVALVANASESMFDGGHVVIETGIDQAGRPHLVIADDGSGMQPWVREHILDPGFSTKAGGKSGGRGLEPLSELIAERYVDLELDSEFGRGTRFDLCFLPPSARIESPVQLMADYEESVVMTLEPHSAAIEWDEGTGTFRSYPGLAPSKHAPDDFWSGEHSSFTPTPM